MQPGEVRSNRAEVQQHVAGYPVPETQIGCLALVSALAKSSSSFALCFSC